MEPAPLSAVSRVTLGSVGRRFRWWLVVALGVGLAAAFPGTLRLDPSPPVDLSAATQDHSASCQRSSPLVIAPMFGGIGLRETGIDNPSLHARVSSDFDTLVELSAELDKLEPGGAAGAVQVGYTMTLPVLSFFRKEGAEWRFSDELWQFYDKLIRQLARPVVVALMANHFSAPSPLLDELRKDSQNLMWLPSGRPPVSEYFASNVVPLTLRTDPGVPANRYRRQAIHEILTRLAAIDREHPGRIAGVALAGELHQLYDDLQGRTGDYERLEVTDYSPGSQADFRAFLRHRFGSLARFNSEAGTDFARWDDVVPPDRDIRRAPLRGFWQHFDSYADGHVPVFGWLDASQKEVAHIDIFVDGRFAGRAQRGINRLDVYEAREATRDPTTGFRFDVDYRGWSSGVHQVDVIAVAADGQRRLIGSRSLSRMSSRQTLPSWGGWSRLRNRLRAALHPLLPPYTGPAWIDHPRDKLALFYNPFAALWQEFRERQVADFLDSLTDVALQSGFDRERIFSHQLLPELNGSWNSVALATARVFHPGAAFAPGITLYGGIATSPHLQTYTQGRAYGVPELHPQQPKSDAVPAEVIAFHRRHCARFISPYFMDIVPAAFRPPLDANQAMRLFPENPHKGSGAFYRAIVAAARD